jgi:hypothetical protein
MALLILPIGLVIGLIVADGQRAVFLTLVIGLAPLRGVEVSPWETLILVVGLPLAMVLASWGARVRQR